MNLTQSDTPAGKMWHRPAETKHGKWDVKIIEEVVVTDCYGIANMKGVRNALDVGGHIGSFGTKLKFHFPEVELTCFEPFSDNFSILSSNLASRPNVRLENSAVVGKPCKHVCFDLNPENSGGNKVVGESSLKVPATMIQNFIPVDGLDLLKLDCDGSETEIIASIPWLLPKIRHIVGEWHGIGTEKLLKAMLSPTHVFSNTQMFTDLGTFEATLR